MDRNDQNLYYIDMNEQQLFEGLSSKSDRILYSANPFARENLFYLQETGRLTATSAHRSHRNYLDSFLFLCITNGKGHVTSENREFSLKKGDGMFIDCHHPWSHESTRDFWSLSWIHFNGVTMAAVYRKFMERSGSSQFSLKNPSDYQNLLDRIYETAHSESHVRDMEIHQLISLLLTSIMKDCWNEERVLTDHRQSERLQEVKEFLRSHYEEKISLDDLAGRFFINKYYLTRLFRRQYGTTISDYIFELRLSKAKQLLRFSSFSLDEIARQCGFYDLAYFSRQFKKAEGISPSAFRKQWM